MIPEGRYVIGDFCLSFDSMRRSFAGHSNGAKRLKNLYMIPLQLYSFFTFFKVVSFSFVMLKERSD